MKLIRWLFALAVVGVLLAAVWLWLKRPQKTDMAAYAPAHALIYLEFNSPVDIAQTIVGSDAWRSMSPHVGKTDLIWLQRRWIREFVSYSGIGSAPTVIITRSQVAVVMLDLGAKEQGETLTIKPEVAILIETHTSEGRVRTAVEEVLRRFAEKAYKQPIFRVEEIDGARFMLWTAPSGGRQIAALIDGSFVIMGNSEKVVKICLEVRRGRRASLRGNPELEQMRLQLASERALAFGFVSSANAARLLSLGAPLFFGNAAGAFRIDSILSSSAAKILTGLGWSSQPRNGGIEDRYVISLAPILVSRLRPAFRAPNAEGQFWRLLPKNIYSLTVYKFEEPGALWSTLETAVSSQVDTLSAVLFSSVFKSAFLPYGIKEPEKFLSLVGPELITLRETENAERAILIAQVRNEQELRTLLTAGDSKNSWVNTEPIEIPGTRSTFSFLNGYLILGTKDDVRHLMEMTNDNNGLTEKDWRARVARFGLSHNLAGSLTYTDESSRVRAFLSAIFRVQYSTSLVPTPELERALAELPYSATDTTLSDHGLDRRTISSFGQFSALLPLLFPEH